MKIIGITGGVGAGKSRILAILKEQYHAEIIEADRVAKELEEPGKEGFRQLVACFGDGILDQAGAIDRAKFAERIFRDEASLRQVNEIIHPLTWNEIRRRAGESAARLVVVEAALFDEKSKNFCDELWYIDTSVENRISRLMANRGYTRKKCLDIMKNQRTREDFTALADVVIDNNGGIGEAEAQIQSLLGTAEKKD